MRQNTILAVAITATLSTLNMAHAGTLKHVTVLSCYTAITTGTASPCTIAPTSGSVATSPVTTALATIKAGLTGYVPTKTNSLAVVYGSHIFGSSSSGIVLPSDKSALLNASATTSMLAKYKVEGSIGFNFDFKLSLSNGAKFKDDPSIYIVSTIYTGASSPTATTNSCSAGACSWPIPFENDDKLVDGDVIYIAYHITNVQALGTPGETINLTATLGDAVTTVDTQVLPVATSQVPFTVKLYAATGGPVRASVASGNTELSAKTATNELLSQYSAILGYLEIKNDTTTFANDGVSIWKLGDTTGGVNVFKAATGTGGKNTSLTITEGQFAASVTPETGATTTGDVTLRTLPDNGNTLIVAAKSVTSTTATFELTDANLAAITGATDEGKVAIAFTADGKTAINIEENAPTATLVIDYHETTSAQDINYPEAELRKIRQDGSTCWLYNIPKPTAQDILNIRITNESSVAGTLMATLYNQEGGEAVFTNLNLFGAGGDIQPGATKRVTQDNIENLEGGPHSWTGRGIMFLSSTLPDLEMMALMRQKTPGAPLTNLSTGASGVACKN
jgi:hypothetical protein